ncbi:unnamed protein product [Eruca vesicaria subsp. sativa]|uniref:Uncharacterized protein n=1 Tax=Eruca vesicaria subsp. sativa TaxID=29727 RepID=A0ABC8LYU9_ERUVS|nr:unnamed protein product [Eruca vesicaria subsp. sativa]
MDKSGGRKVMDEIRSFEKASLFDLGHPLLNRIADSFVKAAGVGALQAVSREAYFTVVDGAGFDASSMGPPSENNGSKKHRFPNLRGSLVMSCNCNTMSCGMAGLAAGLYSGITYGMKEARGGAHDWRNSAVAGALTGAAMAMTTSERTSHEQVVQSALTGAAISTAANLLSSVF